MSLALERWGIPVTLGFRAENVLDDPPLRTGAYVQNVTGSEATVAMITAHPAQVVCTVRDASGALIKTVVRRITGASTGAIRKLNESGATGPSAPRSHTTFS